MTLPSFGECTLPPLSADVDRLWDTILGLADRLPATSWVLVGGQMVLLHGLRAERVSTRTSEDIDVLADLVSSPTAVSECVRAVRELGYMPTESTNPDILHRFTRPEDQTMIDVLAPDHAPPRRRPFTVPPRTTVRVEGGRQALQRAGVIDVHKADRSALVPVPSVLGALVLKAAAYQIDSRDPERHLYDAAFLASLVTDPIAARSSFKGSDGKRLRILDRHLADRNHEAWWLLGEHREDAQTRWQLLLR